MNHMLAPQKLAPDVSRILFVKSLPFSVTAEELYDIFGKFGPVYQIRLGTTPTTKGRAFVVYEDIYDAQKAVQFLNGFNIQGRYLVVLYHSNAQQNKEKQGAAIQSQAAKREDKKQSIEEMKFKFGVKGGRE